MGEYLFFEFFLPVLGFVFGVAGVAATVGFMYWGIQLLLA